MSKEFLNHVELTSQPVESKLKTQGNFMENSGGQDGLRPVEPRETSRTNQPNSPFTESSIERVDPSAKEEIVRLVGDIEKKPLEKWTEKEILDRWVQLQASLGGASGTSTFTGALVGELARRNGEEPSQLTDIFDNLFKAAEESETGSDPFVLRANMDDEPPYIPPGGPPIPPMGPNLPPPDDPWWQGVSEDEKVRIINDFNWERSPIEQRIARANEVVRDIITGEAGRRLDTLQREVAGYTTEREASRAAGHEIRDLEREARFVNEIRRYLAQYPVPEAYGVDVRLLELASHFEELGEELINRIIFKAYEDENETNPYDASMNLYAQSNLDTLLGYLSHRYKDRYKFYISLKTAAGNFHRMNASANSGDLDSFIRIAELINYKQFSLMQKINGAPRVMRLFETKYQQYLGRDGRITSQNYEQLIKDVQRSFEMLNNNGALRSEFTDDREGNSRKLEEWEVARALNVGRIFFNITFRPAEMVASGRVPREGDQSEQKAASFPFEQAAKLMNFIQRGMYRFETGESRGAMKWIVMIKKAYQDYLRSIQKKRGINQYLIIGGMNVNELEAGAMFGASGVLSGWRIENLSYTEIKVSENMTLRQWLDGETRGYKGEMIPRYMRIKEIKGRVKEKIEKNP
ncbi:hypothetical protein M1307_00470, partial [Patescibacteria group bacterium]|nr:hypothetical protein [Patescibacteria group bacterium]